jgi:hypothetical protein
LCTQPAKSPEMIDRARSRAEDWLIRCSIL